MKITIIRTLVITGLLIFLIPNITFSAQENRIALVIGNGAYKSAPLVNPVNDANDMAAALEKCNFKVMKSINVKRKEMRRAIRMFGEEINKGAVGLFYYAGHGIQVEGQNYLVPIDAEVYSEDEVKDECLMVSSVLRKMESAGNRLNIIILDACRDNPFGRSFRSNNMGLAKMDAPTGSILAYATAPGSVAADGTGGNGLYTSRLLLHMNTPGLKIEEVFKRIRIDVVNASGQRQTPWESSSLMGDFYFSPTRGIAVKEQPVIDTKDSAKDTLEHASSSPKVSKLSEVEKDSRIVAHNDGTIGLSETKIMKRFPNQIRASHILIKLSSMANNQETATAMKKIRYIQQKLRDGYDFAVIAKEFSEGPSKIKGGDLGYFGRGVMVKPFEDEAFKLKIGEVSGIVRTVFGLHLIKVTDQRF